MLKSVLNVCKLNCVNCELHYMKTAPQRFAEDLYTPLRRRAFERAILFPSRHVRGCLVDALTGIAGRPMWQPRWVTVDDSTTEISGLRTGTACG